MNDDIKQELERLREDLANIESRRQQLLKRMSEIQAAPSDSGNSFHKTNGVTNLSPIQDKIKVYRSLFRGREEVFPRRFESTKTGKSGYQPVCKNEWVRGICNKPQVKCSNCDQREYVPLTDQIIEWHLRGEASDGHGKDFTIGVYPMLPDEKCWFLAADFDKSFWQEDSKAFAMTCAEMNIPFSLERSRSGNGGHVWLFFDEPIPCMKARAIGSYIITETMERRPELGLDSYDRFFPNQDTLPHGGLGNLIALPLQKKPRENGNSVFLDEHFEPYLDQWQYLSSIRRIDRDTVESLFQKACHSGRIIGLRIPITEEDDRPWETPPSGEKKPRVIGPFPECIQIVLANQIFISKNGLSPSLRNALIRVAAFQNPEFYQKQAMRMPTYNIPRIIYRAEDFGQYIAFPDENLSVDGLGWFRKLIARKYDGSAHRDKVGRPKKDNEIADWILKIREENPQWGSRKICDCLVNLGFEVCRTTVRNVLLLNGYDPEPNAKSTWKQFLRSHWNVLTACDFFSLELLTRKGLVRCMVPFAMELSTRKVEILGVTSAPNGLWMEQVARNVTDFQHGFLKNKKYLIHDRDSLFTNQFQTILKTVGVEPVKLPPRSPNLNAFAERFVRSIKEECLNHLILSSEEQLRYVLSEYLAYYHMGRVHQGLGRIIDPRHEANSGETFCIERLGGLLKSYHRRTA